MKNGHFPSWTFWVIYHIGNGHYWNPKGWRRSCNGARRYATASAARSAWKRTKLDGEALYVQVIWDTEVRRWVPLN